MRDLTTVTNFQCLTTAAENARDIRVNPFTPGKPIYTLRNYARYARYLYISRQALNTKNIERNRIYLYRDINL